MECKKMCSYLVKIEDIEEAEWLSTKFLKKGNGNRISIRLKDRGHSHENIDQHVGLLVWYNFCKISPATPICFTDIAEL